MQNRIRYYFALVAYVLFAVGLNSLSVYLKVVQSTWSVQAAWYVLPPLVLLFVVYSLWLRNLYIQQKPDRFQRFLAILLGILILVVPVIPSVALHLDLPYSVPFLQFAGANILLLPWFQNRK